MLTALIPGPRRPERRTIHEQAELTDDIVWLDMASPTETERRF